MSFHQEVSTGSEGEDPSMSEKECESSPSCGPRYMMNGPRLGYRSRRTKTPKKGYDSRQTNDSRHAYQSETFPLPPHVPVFDDLVPPPFFIPPMPPSNLMNGLVSIILIFNQILHVKHLSLNHQKSCF